MIFSQSKGQIFVTGLHSIAVLSGVFKNISKINHALVLALHNIISVCVFSNQKCNTVPLLLCFHKQSCLSTEHCLIAKLQNYYVVLAWWDSQNNCEAHSIIRNLFPRVHNLSASLQILQAFSSSHRTHRHTHPSDIEFWTSLCVTFSVSQWTWLFCSSPSGEKSDLENCCLISADLALQGIDELRPWLALSK